eukprot:TRINITY_DN3410_c0_g1_i1.p2 TRINITY_DN3410_c0_g1~~TRINITY_DN3410_c0_g1_i1.p2  ORF type:complete len:157 (+),score=2.78 TRINITY_DN3410_c0_g1_i1:263-733(+)
MIQHLTTNSLANNLRQYPYISQLNESEYMHTHVTLHFRKSLANNNPILGSSPEFKLLLPNTVPHFYTATVKIIIHDDDDGDGGARKNGTYQFLLPPPLRNNHPSYHEAIHFQKPLEENHAIHQQNCMGTKVYHYVFPNFSNDQVNTAMKRSFLFHS